MQELRLVLIVLGAVAIAALLLHGLWTSKKEKPVKFGEKPIGKLRKIDDKGFDQDGVGSVRVIKSSFDDKDENLERKEPGLDFSDVADDPLFSPSQKPMTVSDLSDVSDDRSVDFLSIATAAIEDVDVNFGADLDAVSKDIKPEANQKRFLGAKIETTTNSTMAKIDEDVFLEKPPERSQQVIVINVQSRSNEDFDGPELVNFLEQFGMLYGEMDIFHRHADLAGTGKVLFSAANMFNPGSFPLATIHQFTTPGVTFFMTLPCYGEAEQNFKLMLQTAQQVADQLGGLVTDQTRAMLTPQRLDEYREEIKQFHIFE